MCFTIAYEWTGGRYLVVIHHGVEWFNPHRINVSVQHNPLRSYVGDGCLLSHQRRKQPLERRRTRNNNSRDYKALQLFRSGMTWFVCFAFCYSHLKTSFVYHLSILGLRGGWSQTIHLCPLPLDWGPSIRASSSSLHRFYEELSISIEKINTWYVCTLHWLSIYFQNWEGSKFWPGFSQSQHFQQQRQNDALPWVPPTAPPDKINVETDYFILVLNTDQIYTISNQTLRMNVSSGWSLSSSVVFRMAFSNSQSLSRSTSRPGNRSPSNPKKIVTSSVTILGVLKSLNARISTWEEKCPCRI